MGDIGAIMRKQNLKLGEALVKKTHFILPEIENLLGVYRKVRCELLLLWTSFQIKGKVNILQEVVDTIKSFLNKI